MAQAQSFDVQRLSPQADPTRNYWVTPGADIRERFGWNVGLLAHYDHRPLQVVDGSGERQDALIDGQMTGHVMASVVLLERLSLMIDLPVILTQAGDALDASAGVGDLRAQGVVMVWSSRTGIYSRGVSIALTGEMIAPTGDDTAFQGSTGIRGGGGLALEWHLGPRTRLGGAFGYRAAPTGEIFDTTFGDTWRYSIGLERMVHRHWSVVGDIFGEVSRERTAPTSTSVPAELIAGARWYPGSIYVHGGGAVGLTNGVGTPTFRALLGIGYAPKSQRWMDWPEVELDPTPRPEPRVEPVEHVFDDPTPEPECTTERVLESCPAPDAPLCDRGALVTFEPACIEGTCTVVRQQQACGLDRACVQDELGARCEEIEDVEPIAVVDDASSQIVTSRMIFFEFDSDRIDNVSRPIIDAVARALNDDPTIRRVRIEGHTDNFGTDAYNIDLSQRRADSVRTALIERGVAAERLITEGFGLRRPIVANDTEENRARNRRVEFHILERTETAP